MDGDAKTRDMTDEERLAYHIQHSKPIMFALYEQILDLLSSKDVEPNGELAKALRYFQLLQASYFLFFIFY